MFQRAKKLIYQRRWRIFAPFSPRRRDMSDMEKWIALGIDIVLFQDTLSLDYEILTLLKLRVYAEDR